MKDLFYSSTTIDLEANLHLSLKRDILNVKVKDKAKIIDSSTHDVRHDRKHHVCFLLMLLLYIGRDVTSHFN